MAAGGCGSLAARKGINAEALAYMRQRALAGPVIASLMEHAERPFADEAAWLRHQKRLGITDLTVTPDPIERQPS